MADTGFSHLHCHSEYSFLDGQGGPQILMRQGWEVDGNEWKVRMDFGCGAIDWRGIVTNAGV